MAEIAGKNHPVKNIRVISNIILFSEPNANLVCCSSNPKYRVYCKTKRMRCSYLKTTLGKSAYAIPLATLKGHPRSLLVCWL